MKRRKQPAHSHMFQVRIWREDLGAGQSEWRGKVQHALSGRRRYFRQWPDLLVYLQEMLSEVEAEDGSGEAFP
ncbi:MAG: hypothetical protein MAG451_02480 [Anaerolineales bacterium]|nr:hypothetical protein [Anaerolineales bacterium]